MTHPGAATASGEPPIVQYWHSGEVPVEVAELVATFRDRNPDMRHLLFSEAEAEQFIAAHFSEREVAAFRACAVPAMQADYFRYCAVLALGGVYVDADFRCVAPLRPLLGSIEGGLLFRKEPPGFLLNQFFLFKSSGHPLPRLALEVATTNIERRAAQRVQMVTGPWIFSALSVLHRLGSSEALRREVADHGIERLAESFRGEAAAMMPTPSGRKGVPPMVEPLLRAVGDYGRVVEAFEGVRIASDETMADYIREPEIPLPYKQSETYWIKWQKSGRTIFR